jgi:hypothetical protein
MAVFGGILIVMMVSAKWTANYCKPRCLTSFRAPSQKLVIAESSRKKAARVRKMLRKEGFEASAGRVFDAYADNPKNLHTLFAVSLSAISSLVLGTNRYWRRCIQRICVRIGFPLQ